MTTWLLSTVLFLPCLWRDIRPFIEEIIALREAKVPVLDLVDTPIAAQEGGRREAAPIQAPAKEEAAMIAKTLSVVFTDIKGFTARTSSSSRADMLRILEKHEELLKPIVLQHGGTVVKTIGDAFLLTFESPTNAVLCGVRMQARLRDYNAGVDETEHIEIRVAINTGEVELVGSDVFGEAVNLASRVEGITDAGEVYFTEATYLVMNKQEVPTSHVGEYRFKGIPEAIKIYRVLQDENLELYRKVLETQMVPDEVPEGEGSVPEGAFSSGMLLALEQQNAMLARRRWDPLIMAALVVLLLGLLGGATLGKSVV